VRGYQYVVECDPVPVTIDIPSYLPQFPHNFLFASTIPKVPAAMTLSAVFAASLLGFANALSGRDDPAILKRACPDYVSYASTPQ
jgi:hypothetical protein